MLLPLCRPLGLALFFCGPLMAQPLVPFNTTTMPPVHTDLHGNVCFVDFGQAFYGNLVLAQQEAVPATTRRFLGLKITAP